MDTRTIGCSGIKSVMPMRSVINLRGSLLIIPFARMMPQSRGKWLYHGRHYILLAGLERLPLTCHHATHKRFEDDDNDDAN